ncbi:MAG: thioredoxin-disulfide reductase [Flavobacteriales bacterium]|nr:thioredoxin-disulfide reductase [Flavobacteriales bacterium]MCX7768379.1 thioredoxin-disulfide reductase [Flavobacteriales bacterium]MDW8409061.1 thioredoxin-disulfide reductase [Flavobacteriales bacterium]
MEFTERKLEQCVIIGAGPAGYTAAIYASRAALHPLLLAGPQPGGQLMITNEVENFPGFPEGIMGPELMDLFRKQAERFGTRILYESVTEVDFSNPNCHLIKTDQGRTIETRTVIVCTGASAKWLGLESEQRLNGKGVSACAVCDGFFFRGQEVAVVGGGDTACEEAHYLSKLCTTVHMLVRSHKFRASKIMEQRVRNTPNIKIYMNTETLEILGQDSVEGVRVIHKDINQESVIPVKGFFVAIGHKPNTDFLKPWLRLDDNGYVVTKPDSTATDVPGVFVAGDAQDKVYRQAVTAAGTGCMAALEAERYLASVGH